MDISYRFWKRNSKKSNTGILYSAMFAEKPGKWLRTGQDNERDAILWCENYLNNSGNIVKNKIPTLRAFASDFFIDDPHGWRKRQERKNKQHADVYYSTHQGRLDNYILPEFGDTLISAIRPRAIDDWILDLKHTSSKEDLADNSKNKILNCFRIVLQEAMDIGFLQDNPAKLVTFINERNAKREIFSEDELILLFPVEEEEIFRIWGTFSWYLFFRVMAVGGLRPGEVAALYWEDFKPELSGLIVSKSVHYSTGKIKGIKTENKGKKDKITILDDRTVKDLIKYRSECKGFPLDLVFPSINRKTIKPDCSQKHFRYSCERAGLELKGRTQYCLRHTFDTNLLKHLKRDIVNDLMGHTSYRPEYDGRTPEDRLTQLQHVKDVVNNQW
jgi:integrase